ncbi:MAG: IS66 family transposase [Candidatus Pacebacteria bacterium]|nr:IS66 family transposase [Candidatus Paceibacterota bacterium]
MMRLKSELRAEKLARVAAERRCSELEAKVEELNRKVEQLLRGQNATQELLQKTIRKLEKDVVDRDKTIEKQNKTLAWFRKKVYGSTSEKDGSGSATRQKSQKGVNKRGQKPGASGHGRTDRSRVPVGDVVSLTKDCKCEDCGKPYEELDATEESSLFEYVEGLYRDVYERSKYVSRCDCNGKRIVTAEPPPKLYPRTNIGNSLWVKLIVQKFLQGVPTNRTLKELSLLGFPLAQGTVTGGFKIIDGLLEPLYEGIANHCRAADLWNADETMWRVFDGTGIKWWLWIVASKDAVTYVLDETRSGDVPDEFFEGCSGTLMTDRYSAYKGLGEAIRKAWCWVHVRRDFLKIAQGVPTQKGWADAWLKRIAWLFVLNHERFQLWEAGQRTGRSWNEATEKLKKHVKKMETAWQKQLKQPGSDEQFTVLNSLRRHWDGLTLFLEDPRIPLHNNRAERLLRNSVILRKNSYGSGAAWAGNFAAKVFSVFQTWLINGLDPQKMLQAYFDECSKTPGRAPPNIRSFLPWQMSEEEKLDFALPKGYSRPG